MYHTDTEIKPIDTLAVDIYGAAQLLSCGIQTARKIVALAGARIDVPGRRVLYSTQKIKTYIDDNTF